MFGCMQHLNLRGHKALTNSMSHKLTSPVMILGQNQGMRGVLLNGLFFVLEPLAPQFSECFPEELACQAGHLLDTSINNDIS